MSCFRCGCSPCACARASSCYVVMPFTFVPKPRLSDAEIARLAQKLRKSWAK